MDEIPRIRSVVPLDNTRLLVCFDNGVEKIYDCELLLQRPAFALLNTPAFFRAVKVDPGGYGVSWNDNLDISEYELWCNGSPVAREQVDQTA